VRPNSLPKEDTDLGDPSEKNLIFNSAQWWTQKKFTPEAILNGSSGREYC